MSNRPLLVGITGGIGSGKTVICRIFQVLGVPVYNSDDRAKVLMNESETLKADIIRTFGSDSYTRDGLLNRELLARTVFSDQTKLATLNQLVHPAVGADFAQWVDEHSSYPYLLKEAALIFETRSYQTLDFTILVTAPADVRVSRVLSRDPHRTKAQVLEIMDRQLPDADKIKLADYVLENDEKRLLVPQVISIDAQLRGDAKRRARQEV